MGDDAAVVPGHGGRGGYVVACCDLLVEDVDFRRRWASFADVGHKAGAANLSDLAARGPTPPALVWGPGAPATERGAYVQAQVREALAAGQAHGAPLVGGDLSSTSGPLVVSVTALGALRDRAPLRRRTAELGDCVMVFGPLGAARAGLALLEAGAGPRAGAMSAWMRPLARSQRRPQAQVALGLALARLRGVHAVADISDGLLADAGHLVGSGLGVTLTAEALPVARGVQRAASYVHGTESAAATALRWVACGGEDFVLVAAVAKGARQRVVAAARRVGAQAHLVGEVRRGAGVRLVQNGHEVHLKGAAFAHFSQSPASAPASR